MGSSMFPIASTVLLEIIEVQRIFQQKCKIDQYSSLIFFRYLRLYCMKNKNKHNLLIILCIFGVTRGYNSQNGNKLKY